MGGGEEGRGTSRDRIGRVRVYREVAWDRGGGGDVRERRSGRVVDRWGEGGLMACLIPV